MLFKPDFIAHVDGASRGNPGDASYGFVILNDRGKIIHSGSAYIGKATNNEAEYTGLIKVLEFALSKKIRSIEVRSDSELLVKQLHGIYKVRAANLQALNEQCRSLLRKLEWFEVKHVPREQNTIADRLANQALDALLKKK
ncbi:MAG TPA: ribonuclease HI family protein [Acidobacteriota bacterium]|nr:ribonuclease HI family protein [Acidobacteriota bacterium]